MHSLHDEVNIHFTVSGHVYKVFAGSRFLADQAQVQEDPGQQPERPLWCRRQQLILFLIEAYKQNAISKWELANM